MSKDGKKMNAGVIRATAGERVAYMLRTIYRDCVDQRAARDFDVEPRTVRGWLSGNVPQSGHLLALCQKFGPAFREFIFAPPSSEEIAAFDAEIAALRVRADILEMEIKQERQGARGECGSGSHGE